MLNDACSTGFEDTIRDRAVHIQYNDVFIGLLILRLIILLSEEPIEFIRELKDQTVMEIPSTATFECELSKAGLRVQWLRGDEPISSGDKYDITTDGAVHRLIVHDVSGDDMDTYTATVRGKTSSASLTVEGL